MLLFFPSLRCWHCLYFTPITFSSYVLCLQVRQYISKALIMYSNELQVKVNAVGNWFGSFGIALVGLVLGPTVCM